MIRACVLVSVLSFCMGCNGPLSNASKTTSKTTEVKEIQEPVPPPYIRLAIRDTKLELDPPMCLGITATSIASHVHDGLVRLNSEGQPVPAVARSWEVRDEGKTILFRLRDDVYFHEYRKSNGQGLYRGERGEPRVTRKVVASDVKWSLERLLDPRRGGSSDALLRRLQGATEYGDWQTRQHLIETDQTIEDKHLRQLSRVVSEVAGIELDPSDPLSLVFRLSSPAPAFISELGSVKYSIVPHESLSLIKDSHATVGVGPFMLKEGDFIDNEVITLTSNSRYYEGAPKISGLQYWVRNFDHKWELFLSGDLHIIALEPDLVRKLKSNPELIRLSRFIKFQSLHGLEFNLNRAPFGGSGERAKNLRLALSYAIDRKFIATTLLEDVWSPECHIIPDQEGYLPSSDIPLFAGCDGAHFTHDEDVLVAQHYLDQAGYPNGRGLEVFTFSFEDGDPVLKGIAEAIQNDAKKIGLPLALKKEEPVSLRDLQEQGKFQLYRAVYRPPYADPYTWIHESYHSSLSAPEGNTSFYANHEMDSLLDRAASLTDYNERLALYSQAEALVLNASVYIPIGRSQTRFLINPALSDFEIGRYATGELRDVPFYSVSWDEKKYSDFLNGEY